MSDAITSSSESPVSRRWRGPGRDWGLFALLVLVGLAGHLSWAVTEWIQVDLHPLPWILAVYVGYKMGRWSGLAAGLVAVLPWTAFLLWTGAQSRSEVLLGDASVRAFSDLPYLAVHGVSLQAAVVAAFLGWATGWAFDRLESTLGRRGFAFEDLVPVRASASPLPRLVAAVERWLTVSPEGGLSLGGTVRKLRGLSLPILVALLNLYVALALGPFRVALPPRLLAAAVVLVAAQALGAGPGVALAILGWLISWVLWITYFGETGSPYEAPRFALSLESIPQLIGLCILAWWAARVADAWRDDTSRRALTSLWPAPAGGAKAAPSLALSALLLVLAVGVAFDLGPLRLAYSPHYAWCLALGWWAARRNGAEVSRRAFWILLPLTLLAFEHHAPSPNERVGWAIFSLDIDVVEAVLLAALPLAATRLDLRRLAASRTLAFGFLAAWTLAALFLAGGLGPEAYVLDLSRVEVVQGEYGVSRLVETRMVVLSWLLQLGLFEVMARVFHSAARGLGRGSDSAAAA